MPPTDSGWQDVATYFHHALDLPTEEREAYLLREVPAALQDELRSLLGCHSDAEAFLETPAFSLKTPQLEFCPGESFGHFQVDRLIGSGSFARVYLAYDSALGRRVALKVSPAIGQEARTMAPLEHQNIVRVHSESHLEQRGVRVICMQYVPGTTLEKLLKNLPVRETGRQVLEALDSVSSGSERFDPASLKDRETIEELTYCETVVWWGVRIARALAFAHRNGVLHLDIKPANILINPYGTPLLSDFNVSQSTGVPVESRPIGGTWKYMAPEHRQLFESGGAQGRVDRRSDLYSLGVLLREMLGEERTLPACLRWVLERACAQKPSERFVSAEDMADALDGCLEYERLQHRLPPLSALGRFCSRRPLLTLGMLCLIPQLVGSAVNITYNSLRILSALTPAEQVIFHNLCIAYNLVVYPACVGGILWAALPVLKSIASGHFEGEKDRRLLLRLPHWLVVGVTLGWMPGSFLFPLTLHLTAGPVPLEVFGHFFISFTLSWLIALTYSFLGVLSLVLRLWYPRAWRGESGIRRRAQTELSPLEGTLRLFPFMAGLVPLTGAILVIVTGSGSDSPVVFRALTGALIALGMVGAGIALRYSQFLEQTLAALTDRE